MQIFVVLVDDMHDGDGNGDGTTFILEDLNPWDPIWLVMQKIFINLIGIWPGDQTLYFAGQDITNVGTLEEWNIIDQDTLYLYQGL